MIKFVSIKKLINLLKEYPEDYIVIMQQDCEGNGHYPLAEVYGNSSFDEENCEVGISKLTDDLIEQGYSEEDVKEGVPCICLVPNSHYMTM